MQFKPLWWANSNLLLVLISKQDAIKTEIQCFVSLWYSSIARLGRQIILQINGIYLSCLGSVHYLRQEIFRFPLLPQYTCIHMKMCPCHSIVIYRQCLLQSGLSSSFPIGFKTLLAGTLGNKIGNECYSEVTWPFPTIYGLSHDWDAYESCHL